MAHDQGNVEDAVEDGESLTPAMGCTLTGNGWARNGAASDTVSAQVDS